MAKKESICGHNGVRVVLVCIHVYLNTSYTRWRRSNCIHSQWVAGEGTWTVTTSQSSLGQDGDRGLWDQRITKWNSNCPLFPPGLTTDKVVTRHSPDNHSHIQQDWHQGDGDFLALRLGSCCFPCNSRQTAMAVEREVVVSQKRQNKVKHVPKLCFQNHQSWSKGLCSEHALHYHSIKSLKCKKHYYNYEHLLSTSFWDEP